MGEKPREAVKIERERWILVNARGIPLAHGHPDPTLPPYHLACLADDSLPALVSAYTRFALRDFRREWNDEVRRRKWHRNTLVHECKVRITVEEVER